MHNAPPVDYPVGRSLWWWPAPLLLGSVLLTAATERLVNATRHPDLVDPVLPVALAFASLCWVWLILRSWHCQPRGRLRWMPDPADPPGWGWFWCDAEATAPCSVRGVIDLRTAWLLRLRDLDAERRERWVWVDASADPARWPDLRRAVWASRGNPEAVDPSVIFPRA